MTMMPMQTAMRWSPSIQANAMQMKTTTAVTGGAQQATEKDNHVQVLLEDSQTGEALRFVFKGRTWEKVGTPSAPPNQHGAVENETGATASPPVVTPEAAQGVSPDSNVSTNGAVTLQTVVQDRTRSRVAPSLTPLAPRGLEASFTESAQAVPHSAQNFCFSTC
uniref:Uncharacterized protein n=1 Tax=Micromonas pusilla TaxID=38833 RepID=A0A6U0MTI2_MICPS|mmetsp:Transcript_12204/g.51345  ORF Transcript_12204/g.51345 Transcript_12204/m.51345 type:complete len:164 (+) Transcript_12204:1299-1790(+)